MRLHDLVKSLFGPALAVRLLRRDVLACLDQQIRIEMQSGYDENVGILAVHAAASAIKNLPIGASLEAYADSVVAALSGLMKNYSSPIEGEYSDGRSSIGSALYGVKALLEAKYSIVVPFDITEAYIDDKP